MLTKLADVAPEPINWLWPGRIARGKVTLLAGDPGLGKSFVSLDVAARVSTGTPWPESSWPIDQRPPAFHSHGAGRRPPGDVLLLSAEDGLADTIRPRLDALGADPSRIFALEGIVRGGDASGHSPFDLSLDLSTLGSILADLPNPSLIVIDPVTAYLGSADEHKNAQVRSVLHPLADLAAAHGAAVLMVTHLNKATDKGNAAYRTMGSLAFLAAARGGWLVSKDRGDPSLRQLTPIKNNIGPDRLGLSYRIDSPTGRLLWEPGPSDLTADAALSGRPGPPPLAPSSSPADDPFAESTKAHACSVWLRQFLADGPVRVEQVTEAADARGFTEKQLRNVRTGLGILSTRKGFGSGAVYSWELPPGLLF